MAISQIDIETGLDGESGLIPFFFFLKYFSALQDNLNEWEIISAPEKNDEGGTYSVSVGDSINDSTDQGGGMNDQSGNGAPSHSPKDSREKPKDFDNSANVLWNLYGKEAKDHDEARMQTLRDDMDGLLIFVCISYQPMIGQPS